MQYVGDLITQCREDTGNQSYSTNTGITDAKILRALNYGLENLQGLILQTNPKLFQYEVEINLVADQEEYSIPDRIYLGTRIVNVDYSFSGESRDYVKIYETSLVERSAYFRNYVYAYIRRNDKILITPKPNISQGKIRVTYERQLDSLALRAGTIDSVTIGSGQITALSLDVATDVPDFITTPNHFCVSSSEGLVKAYNVPYSAYNTTSGDFTLTATNVVTGQTPANNDYVTIGKYTTTHANMADNLTRFIVMYANLQLLGKDSAQNAKSKYFSDELEMIKQEVVRSYQEADKDDDRIQISNWGLIVR